MRNVVGGSRERAGRGWLARLPALLAEVAAGWALELGEPYALTFNYVTRVTRADGTPAVLKLTPPGRETLPTEAATLRLAAGAGAVRLLAADLDRGALLLERAEPGEPLTGLHRRDDDAATRVAAEVGLRLHRPVPPADAAGFPTVEEWARKAFGWLRASCGGPGPLPGDLVDGAERIHHELVASSAPPVLLHGDLHHDNVLSAERGWLAVDPQGVLGEPAYEAAALLRNPPGFGGRPEAPELLARRVAILAEAYGVGPDRIRGWGIAHNVVSLVWSLHDGAGRVDEDTLTVVRALHELTPR